MGKRASPGGLSSNEEKELDRLIAKTGLMSQKKPPGGRIGYRLGDEVEQVTEEVVETPEGIQTVDLDNIPDWWLTMILPDLICCQMLSFNGVVSV